MSLETEVLSADDADGVDNKAISCRIVVTRRVNLPIRLRRLQVPLHLRNLRHLRISNCSS